ncbi:MAG: hypothetical protein GC160_13015 [Acidobacteria bacterium]|nr:hypothetical protein [Acidobacteriota bacterium]
MRYRRLGRTDLEPSILGYGASPLGEEFGPIDAAEGERAVHAAIDAGVNFFDTAPYYGRTLSETRLGQALRGRRDRVILATKCCRDTADGFDFSARRVTDSLDESLRRLGTDYVDLLQIHDIEFGDRRQILEEALPAARRAQQAGKARWIGVTGLQLEMLEDVARRFEVDTVLSYARYNLAITDLDRSLRPFAEERGIGLINASPLLLGALTHGAPPPWHPAAPELLEACAKVDAACRDAGVALPALALRFCLDHPYVSTTLVGMSNREQLAMNLAALDFEIDAALLRKIRSLLEPVSGRIWASGLPENHDQAAKIQ